MTEHEEHHEIKDYLSWLITGAIVIAFVALFINGSQVHIETGVTDEDISTLYNN